jgi:ribosomal protein L40E
MDLVTIDRFTSIGAANVARATLEAAGIDAFLADEIDSHAHGGIRLQVPREEIATALDVLREAHANTSVSRPEPLPPLEPGDFCRRCGSDEIYPAISRARAYARALILSMFGGVLVQFVVIVARTSGVDIPQRAINGMFLLALAAPLITALVINIAPRMICRNCNARWRAGTNLPS